MSGLATAAAVYGVAERLEVVHHDVHAGLFGDFSAAVSAAVIAAGDDVEDDDAWSTVLRYLKKLRFVLSSTPLWLAHPSRHHCVGTLAGRDRLVQDAELSRPTAITALRTAFAFADEMHREGSSELRTAAGDIAEAGANGRIGFLIKSPSLAECASGSLKQEFASRGLAPSWEVVTPSQLRTVRPFDELVVFGPTMWYPQHLLGAPKAARIHVVAHEWIKDHVPARLRFEGAAARDVPPEQRARRVSHTRTSSERRTITVEGSDLLPTVDVRRLREMSRASGEAGSSSEDARVFLLEGGKGVFLGADEGSARFTIDIEEVEVRRTPVNRIEAGDFIVLRTEGSGDYIRTVADAILGDRAAGLRSAQEAWKQPLRQMIRTCGSTRRAAQVLAKVGVPQATPGNIARWASAENICCQDDETFASLSQALKVVYDVDRVWHQMSEIRGAHTSAGAAIKRQLHEKVTESDLEPLRARGVMEFKLDAGDAGTLTAFRVNQVGTEIYEVDSSQLGRPFDLED